VKVAIHKMKLGSTWLCLALACGILAGCSSPTTQNRKVYDRYAALVAERNRALRSPEEPKAKTKKSSRSSKESSDTLNRRPVRRSSTTKQSTSTKKSSTSQKKKAAAEPAKPAPIPAPAPPVRVIAPAPVLPVQAEAVKKASVQSTHPPADPASAAVPPVKSGSTVGYTLKVGDGVQVFLRGIPAPDAIEDVIDEVGMISLPLINDVQAAGLTASALERSIRKMYLDKDIYRNISVNVVVPTRFYFIQGEIQAPGRFQIVSATRVSQAIAGAGGYTEYASGKVIVKRGGKIHKVIRNAKRLERTPDDDIMLEPDDIIEVRRSMW